jgi:hypothetical protein
MAGRSIKRQKQIESADQSVTRRRKVSQYLFAFFAFVVILSMVVTAFATY